MSTTEPHPALPPTAPSQVSIPVPDSPKGLYDLVQATPNPDTLIPVLHKIAGGINQHGRDKNGKAKKGEEVLTLSEWKIEELDDETIHRLTGIIVFVLTARIKADDGRTRATTTATFDIAIRLCNVGQPEQFGMCLDRVGLLSTQLLDMARHLKKDAEIIIPLYTLLRRSAPPGVFTAIHSAFLESALIGRKHFNLAAEMTDLIFVDYQTANPDYRSVLTFYLHAGTVAAARREFEKARNLFLIAVIAPSHGVSAIQQQCVKRAVLCEIVVSGKMLRFPKYTSQSVGRLIEKDKTIETYIKFSRAFAQRDWAKVDAISTDALFKHDKNEGLVRQVVASVPARRILDIREAYTRMTLQDLAGMLGMRDEDGCSRTEGILREMVDAGQLSATITPGKDLQSAIVTLNENDDPATKARTLAELRKLNQLTEWMEKQLTHAYRSIGVSEVYLKKQTDLQKSRANGGSGLNAGKMDDFEMMVMNEGGGKGKGGKVGMDMGDMGY